MTYITLYVIIIENIKGGTNMKTNIESGNFYLKKLICVLKSEINNCTNKLYTNGRHSHAFVYILSGSCTYNFADIHETTVNKGDILYLAHNSAYTMQVHTKNYRFIFCDFELDDNIVRESKKYTPQDSSDAENRFIKLVNSYNMFSKTSFSKCMSLIYDIYGLILSTAEKCYLNHSVESRIFKAKEYIDTHFSDKTISISALAKQAGMSEVYFRKLFGQKYNLSPVQYLISVRIKKAKQLLCYDFLNLNECALQCGFLTAQYFCRVFKKATDMTPNEYREGVKKSL